MEMRSFWNKGKIKAFACGASAGREARDNSAASEFLSSVSVVERQPLDRPDFIRSAKDMASDSSVNLAAVLLALKRAELAGRSDVSAAELHHAARDIPVNPVWSVPSVILAGFEAGRAGKNYVSSADIRQASGKIACPLRDAAPTVLLAVVNAELSGSETVDLDAAHAVIPENTPNGAAAVLLAAERAKLKKAKSVAADDIERALRDMPGNPRWNEAAVMIAAHNVFMRGGSEIGTQDLKKGLHEIVGESPSASAVSLLAVKRVELAAAAKRTNTKSRDEKLAAFIKAAMSRRQNI